MQFMGNFTPDNESHYTDGWIYNPHDGGTYSASITLVDRDTMKLRGYLFSRISRPKPNLDTRQIDARLRRK